MPKIIFRPNPTPPPFVPPTPPTPPAVLPGHIKINPLPWIAGSTAQVTVNISGYEFVGDFWCVFVPEQEGNEITILDSGQAVITYNIARQTTIIGRDCPENIEPYLYNGEDNIQLILDN